MTASNPPKKKCPIDHPWLLTVVVAGAAAVIGFVLWSRSRPAEDPWAEESWGDIDDDNLVVVTDYDEEGEDKQLLRRAGVSGRRFAAARVI